MVKNVIFDVGDVLMDFPLDDLTAAFTDTAEDARLLRHEIFDHPDWITTDRATPWRAALEAMCTHIPQRLHAAAGQIMEKWDQYLVPNEEVNALAKELKGLGCKLYILSNTSERFYSFRSRIPAYPLMDGAILSFEEKLLKPDPEIFRRLFSRFGLAPNDCFFIDDAHLNIEAAHWCGMQGALYCHEIAPIRAALRSAGVPVSE